MKNKIVLPLIALLVGAVLFFVFHKKNGDILRVEFDANPSRVSVLNSPGQTYGLVFSQIYETLFFLKTSGSLAPQLVETWNSNDEFTEFIFTLKKGVLFHNGQKLTSKDVVSSLKYVQKKRPDENFLDVMNKVKTIEVIDDLTFKITLNESYFEFLYFLASPATKIMPSRGSLTDEEYEKGWIGTGAYKLEKITDQKIELARFSGYREEVGIDRVIFQKTKDPLGDLNKDLIDLVYIERKNVEKYQQMKDYRVLSSPMLGSFWLGFNLKHGPTKDLRMRKAIYHSIDRSKIVEGVTIKNAMIPASIVPYGILGYESSQLKYDMALSQKLVKEIPGKKKELKLLIPNKLHRMGKFAIERISRGAKQLGIAIKVVKAPLLYKDRGVIGNYYQYLRDYPKSFDLYIRGLVSPLASAEQILRETFLKDGKMNFGGYSSAIFEKRLLSRPRSILESDIQSFCSDLIGIINNDYPVVPLGNLFSNKLLRANKNFKFNGVTPFVTLFKDSLRK